MLTHAECCTAAVQRAGFSCGGALPAGSSTLYCPRDGVSTGVLH